MNEIEPRVIEDDSGATISEASSKTINDHDKLERLERNLQKAKEMNEVGSTLSEQGEKEVKKLKREKVKKVAENDSNIVYAPSIDEVTADNDHLANLRGEGRYFGVVDPDINEPVCSNCHRRGHRRAQCKVVVCHACGKVDDHYETQCPNSMVCSNCGEKGHFRNNCPSKRKVTYCVICDSRNHTSDRCPSIWRSYVLKKVDPNSKIAYPSSKIFCYNCSAKGHYGDDCNQQRISKTPNINGSAFSGENLPKALISQYRNVQDRDAQYQLSHENRKRKFDETRSTNYNYAPPPYPRFGRDNVNTTNGNYNNYNNNNFPRGPKPTKVGYIPPRNNNSIQSQGRNSNNYNGSRNNQNYNSRTSYFKNNKSNNNGNYNRGNYNKRRY